jgi:hypothetical protein
MASFCEDTEVGVDIYSEQLLSLTDAAKSLPGRPAASTIFRWRLRGVRGVKLETCLIGGRRYTSMEALERFSAATTASADGQPLPVRTPSQRQLAIKRAEQELGIPKTQPHVAR